LSLSPGKIDVKPYLEALRLMGLIPNHDEIRGNLIEAVFVRIAEALDFPKESKETNQ